MYQIFVLILLIIMIHFMPMRIYNNTFIKILLLSMFLIFDAKIIPVYFAVFFLKYFQESSIEKFQDESSVPLKIFQTWHTKQLPYKMQKCVDDLKKANPEFEHYLYDDEDCRNFIKYNFDKKVLNAYDKLKPGAYKADLWRLCVLYKEGGIYLDIKLKCNNGFKLINLINNEHLAKDVPYWYKGKTGIYNAFLITKPHNEYIKKCIDKIVSNVDQKYYGKSPLHITGPGMMGEIYDEDPSKAPRLDIIGMLVKKAKKNLIVVLYYKGKKIIVPYEDYKKERSKYSKTKHYEEMWREKDVYN